MSATVLREAPLFEDTQAVYVAGEAVSAASLLGFVRHDPDGKFYARDRGRHGVAATIRRFNSVEEAVEWLQGRAAGMISDRASAAKLRMQDPEKRAIAMQILNAGRKISHARRREAAAQ